MLNFILLIVGLFVLIKSADFLVEGAASISKHFKIAPIVIGLTVVSFGTSAPELVISTLSALKGNTGIAFGNIIGSNIANILLILGAAATIYPLTFHKNTIWKEIPMSFFSALLLVLMGFRHFINNNSIIEMSLTGTKTLGHITRADGIILLGILIIFFYYIVSIAKTQNTQLDDIKLYPWKKSIIFLIAGAIGLVMGSKLTVDNAVAIAKVLNVSDNVIGLTIISFGTSLPELATSITAALKRQSDIAIGNVVGSNIFNILLVLATTVLFAPIPVNANNFFDILVLFATTIFLFISSFIFSKHKITRIEGMFMITDYIIYTVYVFYRG